LLSACGSTQTPQEHKSTLVEELHIKPQCALNSVVMFTVTRGPLGCRLVVCMW
ncbi:hypothetical protein T4D_7605, partial [Trichinella pseudospiralis]